MRKQQQQVLEFYKAFDEPFQTSPHGMVTARRVVMGNLMAEEVNEFINAQGLGAQAKELADVLYVALATAVELGIDIEAVFAIVHANNMTKAWPDGTIRRYLSDGKVLKPPGFKHPHDAITAELVKQRLAKQEFVVELHSLFAEHDVERIEMPFLVRAMAWRMKCRQMDIKVSLLNVYHNHAGEFQFEATRFEDLTINFRIRKLHYMRIDGKWRSALKRTGDNDAKTTQN